MAGGLVRKEHAVPCCGQQALALGDEPVGVAGVAEVQECLA
ncbi:hypothetical protein [Streptomyces sp. NPDC058476]